MESTGARMNRLGSSLLHGPPLLEPDEIMERIDAVTMDDLRALTDELWAPERLSAAGIGPDEDAFRAAVAEVTPAAEVAGRVIRVAVAGAAGRMGQMVCGAVEGAEDMELTGRADPALGTPVADVLADADVLVDFTQPDQALGNAREALAAGVHVVIGTSGFDHEGLREAARRVATANAFVAPNFAIGAVLMMTLRRRGVEAHGARRDHRAPPPGEARRAVGHGRPHGRDDGGRRADPLRPAARDRRRPGGHPRRRRPDAHDPPRHDRPHELHARRAAGGAQGRRAARVPGDRARAAAVALVAVTDHAVERYGQRVRGPLDPRTEIAARVGGRSRPGARSRASAARQLVRDLDAPVARLRLHAGPPAATDRVVSLWEEGEGRRRTAKVDAHGGREAQPPGQGPVPGRRAHEDRPRGLLRGAWRTTMLPHLRTGR